MNIVVLNWNAWDITERCLDSIKALNYPNYEITIVDNGSQIAAPIYFKEKYLNCRIHQIGENLGYTGGNNAGIKTALSRHADLILILNNDAVIEDPDMLNKLVVCFLALPAVGIVGPKLREYSPNGALIGDGYALSRSLQLLISVIRRRFLGRSLTEKDFYRETVEEIGCQTDTISVPFVSGSVMLISRQVFDLIGFLDEQLFMYDDETDFCLRALEAGLKIIYVQNTSVARVTCTTEEMPAYRAYLQGRNRFLLARKRKTWLQSAIVACIHLLSSLRITVILIKHKRWKEVTSMTCGLWDGVVGHWGITPKLRGLIARSITTSF